MTAFGTVVRISVGWETSSVDGYKILGFSSSLSVTEISTISSASALGETSKRFLSAPGATFAITGSIPATST